MGKVSLFGLVLALSGCDWGMATTPETSPSSGGTPGTQAAASTSEILLRALLPADAVLVGAAIAPDDRRYVLDQWAGLYEIVDGQAILVLNTTGLNGVELTDVVALGADRFALTAENDGFLLDARANTFSSYFCYLPSPPMAPSDGSGAAGGSGSTGGVPSLEPISTPTSVSQTLQLAGVAVKQRTESVAFNPRTRQLFAQPRTTRLDTGAVAGSELFVFGETGGEPISVLALADGSFAAAGMAVTTSDRLLLGAGSAIFEATSDGGLETLRQLDSSIVITGMALAPNGDVWVLDGAGMRLLKLEPNL